jgi:hypothetical protein
MNVDENDMICEFEEKPAQPKSNLASVGIYIFQWEKLRAYLLADEADANSTNDFGKDVIPAMLRAGERMCAYRFSGYWKDVGTIESLWTRTWTCSPRKARRHLRQALAHLPALSRAPAAAYGTGGGRAPQFVTAAARSTAAWRLPVSSTRRCRGGRRCALLHSHAGAVVEADRGEYAILARAPAWPRARVGAGRRASRPRLGHAVLGDGSPSPRRNFPAPER